MGRPPKSGPRDDTFDRNEKNYTYTEHSYLFCSTHGSVRARAYGLERELARVTSLGLQIWCEIAFASSLSSESLMLKLGSFGNENGDVRFHSSLNEMKFMRRRRATLSDTRLADMG